jgi:hypothetical protein
VMVVANERPDMKKTRKTKVQSITLLRGSTSLLSMECWFGVGIISPFWWFLVMAERTCCSVKRYFAPCFVACGTARSSTYHLSTPSGRRHHVFPPCIKIHLGLNILIHTLFLASPSIELLKNVPIVPSGPSALSEIQNL